jgi:hypothetical protein
MEKVRNTLLLLLGGAVCGSLGGVLVGSVAGSVYGAFRGDVSLGLDGALLGGLLAAFAGLIYGAALSAGGSRTPPKPRDPGAPAAEDAVPIGHPGAKDPAAPWRPWLG